MKVSFRLLSISVPVEVQVVGRLVPLARPPVRIPRLAWAYHLPCTKASDWQWLAVTGSDGLAVEMNKLWVVEGEHGCQVPVAIAMALSKYNIEHPIYNCMGMGSHGKETSGTPLPPRRVAAPTTYLLLDLPSYPTRSPGVHMQNGTLSRPPIRTHVRPAFRVLRLPDGQSLPPMGSHIPMFPG